MRLWLCDALDESERAWDRRTDGRRLEWRARVQAEWQLMIIGCWTGCMGPKMTSSSTLEATGVFFKYKWPQVTPETRPPVFCWLHFGVCWLIKPLAQGHLICTGHTFTTVLIAYISNLLWMDSAASLLSWFRFISGFVPAEKPNPVEKHNQPPTAPVQTISLELFVCARDWQQMASNGLVLWHMWT